MSRLQSGPEKIFDRAYYERIFHGGYEKNNPPYKHLFFVKEIRRHMRTGRLLEVGCGFGYFLKYARDYFDCTGIEASSVAFEEAKKVVPDVPLLQCSLEDFPEDGAFDVICCFDVLEHIANLNGALVKIRSLLRPGGILVVVVPVYDTVLGRLYALTDKDETHLWKTSRSFWLEKLSAFGFRVLERKGLFRHLFFNRLYVQSGGAFWDAIAPGLFIIAVMPV